MTAPRPAVADGDLEATIREVCERLATVDTTPCSPGEREAAEWLAERLGVAGATEVALEEEPSWGTFPPNVVAAGAVGALGAFLVLRGGRVAGSALAFGSILAVLDEAENGPRLWRRAIRRERTTVNVVARAGPADAARTLVVLGHHDAAQTGRLYDQGLQMKLHERFPGLLRRFKRQPPQWWLGVAGQALAVAGALTGRRRWAAAGLGVQLAGLSLIADIMRSPTVPGANDNLSGVAVLVALAEVLRAQPVDGLRVWLVSAGAEETLQDGIRGFVGRHRHELDPARTWVLNNDTVGSPRLIMVEAEGPFWMRQYRDPEFRGLVAACAREDGIPLERGFTARASTDSVITSRAGLPTTTLASLTAWQAMANYHLPSDVPANLDYTTIAAATRLTHAVARALASRSDAGPPPRVSPERPAASPRDAG